MTNEEKAKEIIAQLKTKSYITPILEDRIYHSLISIAKWKEKQYVEAFAPILIELDELNNK